MQKLPDEQLRWKESGRKELLKTRVLTVTERESVSPDGQTGQYVVLEAPDWVITIPVLEGDPEKAKVDPNLPLFDIFIQFLEKLKLT